MAREEARRHGTPGACFTMDDVFADDADSSHGGSLTASLSPAPGRFAEVTPSPSPNPNPNSNPNPKPNRDRNPNRNPNPNSDPNPSPNPNSTPHIEPYQLLSDPAALDRLSDSELAAQIQMLSEGVT